MLAERALSADLGGFETISIRRLEAASAEEIDRLNFGVIGLTRSGVVELFSEPESRMAGVRQEETIGARFFSEIGRCMNNKRVAGRFEEEPELDEIIDYVLTLRMKITPARLRLLSAPSARLRYLLVQR